jgi:secreted Zn-dependent insulinase-like peptidase
MKTVRQKSSRTNLHARTLAGAETMYRKTTLPTGLRIITEAVPSVHSLAIGVWADTGSRDEAPEENGISHFIEHSVFKGTHSRRTHHIAQYLEAVGGYVNAFTTKDTTCFYGRVLRPHLPRAVHLLADIIQNPVFPIREIEKEKQVIIEELRGAEDDPEDLVHEYFEELLYGQHPLGGITRRRTLSSPLPAQWIMTASWNSARRNSPDFRRERPPSGRNHGNGRAGRNRVPDLFSKHISCWARLPMVTAEAHGTPCRY